jgi:hypothetical protein
VAAALEALVDVTVQSRFQDAAEAAEQRAIGVLSRNAGTVGLSASGIGSAVAVRADVPLPVLWLTGNIDGMSPERPGCVAPALWLVPFATLADFVARL